MAKKRYQDGGEVMEGPNENIGDDTRRRAMEAVRRRMAGEAEAEAAAPVRRAAPVARPAPRGVSADDEASSMRDYRATAARANARPVTPADIPTDAPRPDIAASTRPRASGNSLEDRVKQNLPALGGVGLPAAARGVGRLAGGLASASRQGWKAGEAEKAAARSELRYPQGRREADRMESEGPVRTAPVARGRGVRNSMRERTPEEEMMQGEGGRYAKGGAVSASRRADGAAQRGKTRGRIC